MSNPYLLSGAIMSAVAAMLHLGCIVFGAPWYRFFGAGEGMAGLAEAGSVMPAAIAMGIAAVLVVCIRTSHWMQDLAARYPGFAAIRINQLLIPGSHDSGTSKMGAAARTQALTIREQLEHGIRYLDIRPRVHSSTFYVHHGQTGPDGSADLGHYPTTNPDDPANNKYIFKQIRDFLIDHPEEILILKFQNYSEFSKNDYFNFMEVIKSYFTITTQTDAGPKTICQIACFDHGTGASIRQQSIASLVKDNKRVFVIWSTTDVPTGDDSRSVWNWAFQFKPSLEPHRPFNLWDPYWHDASGSLADDRTDEELARWWGWHEKNLTKWAANPDAGFFVLQSQMQQLPIGDAEASAKRNNARNISHYIRRADQGHPMNVMTFDFVNHGDLSAHIIGHYERRFGH